MSRPSTREQVYNDIDTERDYQQNVRMFDEIFDGANTPVLWNNYIDNYQRAAEASSDHPQAYRKNMVKVAALAVAALAAFDKANRTAVPVKHDQ